MSLLLVVAVAILQEFLGCIVIIHTLCRALHCHCIPCPFWMVDNIQPRPTQKGVTKMAIGKLDPIATPMAAIHLVLPDDGYCCDVLCSAFDLTRYFPKAPLIVRVLFTIHLLVQADIEVAPGRLR